MTLSHHSGVRRQADGTGLPTTIRLHGPVAGFMHVRFDPAPNGNHHLMTTHPDTSTRRATGDTTPDRDERSARLDQLEREIAIERDRLNRTDVDDQRPALSGNPADRPSGSVPQVDLPELEERVTESQREAWALGYQAGIADSQTRTGGHTPNPFHPLRGL